MAEEVKASAAVDATKAIDEPTRSTEAPAASAAEGAEPATGDDAAAASEGVEGRTQSPSKEAASAEAEAADANANASTEAAGNDTANGTPASKKGANNKRKSGASVPEHRRKSLGKAKKEIVLHLDAKAGDFYFVSMKGHPPWPVVICDEEMLPETLLSKRPVSAMRIDGTYREDFANDGKHVRDRRYPVMFLGTNEFSWEANYNLQTLDIEDVKKQVEAGNTQKKKKALWEAYEVAAEEHDLQWFKDMLEGHEKALQVDAEEKAANAAKKQEKKEKKNRKSVPAEDSDDVEMEDADEVGATPAKKPKQNKKRKKDADSEGESEKPAKTPKTKLKLNNKAKDASATKPKETKPKKTKAKSDSDEPDSAKVEEKPLTEAERRLKEEKSVLYLRHRLQKGFLPRDQAPNEEEMANMSEYLQTLEEFKNLEAETIRKTKVHKVLKAIMKLDSIPKEDVYNFKKRSADLLHSWSGALAADDTQGDAAASSAAPATNGVKNGIEKKDVAAAAKTEDASPGETGKAKDAEGDVPMTDAKDDKTAAKADSASDADATAKEVIASAT